MLPSRETFRPFAVAKRISPAILAAVALTVFVPACRDGSPPSGSKSGKSETASGAGAAAYAVTIGIPSGFGPLGAVQFDVKTSAGEFAGMADKVECENVSGAAMIACNNKGKKGLSCALIDSDGIETPNDLITCRFSAGEMPSAADFSIQVVDSSDTAMQPMDVEISVTGITGG